MKPFLKSIPPFAVLDDKTIDLVALETREIRAQKGFVFFQEGERSDWVYLVRKGRVRIQHFRPNGSVRTVCVIGTGETFCCLPAMDGGPYPASAVASVDSHVYRLPGPLFRQLIETDPKFARQTLQNFCGRLREAGCEGCGLPDDAGARLASKIVTMAEKFGTDVPLTRRELGELAGTTVETAIRTIKQFESQGWVELGRGRLRVRDSEALRRRSRGESQALRIPLRVSTKGNRTMQSTPRPQSGRVRRGPRQPIE